MINDVYIKNIMLHRVKRSLLLCLHWYNNKRSIHVYYSCVPILEGVWGGGGGDPEYPNNYYRGFTVASGK